MYNAASTLPRPSKALKAVITFVNMAKIKISQELNAQVLKERKSSTQALSKKRKVEVVKKMGVASNAPYDPALTPTYADPATRRCMRCCHYYINTRLSKDALDTTPHSLEEASFKDRLRQWEMTPPAKRSKRKPRLTHSHVILDCKCAFLNC